MKFGKVRAMVLAVAMAATACGGDPIVGTWTGEGITMEIWESYNGTMSFDDSLLFLSVLPGNIETNYEIALDSGELLDCWYSSGSDDLGCTLVTSDERHWIGFKRREF